MPEYRTFTAQYSGIAKNLITPASIFSEFVIGKQSDTVPLKVTALWDTGATGTCIKPWLKDRLNLRLFGTQTRITGVGGEIKTFVAYLNVRLMSDVEIDNCPMYVADFPGFADILIGMDIISMGDFAICNTDGKTSFSFAIPPFPDRINFTDKAKIANC